MSLELLESKDSFANLRNVLRAIAQERGEWAGIPIPVDGEELIIEPTYPYAQALGKKEEEGDSGIKVRNRLWSTRWRCYVYAVEKEGRVYAVPDIGTGNQATMLLTTLGCSFAWGIEQESAAVKLLGTLVTHIAFKQYMLTGMFLETSQRSGVTYIFRRLRPTVAIKPDANGERMRILAALCMHPIGYYADSWAGAMCPTDDVIAHLMLMRGDEPRFWARCSQHHPHHPQAGLA